jgi:hypothetical protein
MERERGVDAERSSTYTPQGLFPDLLLTRSIKFPFY